MRARFRLYNMSAMDPLADSSAIRDSKGFLSASRETYVKLCRPCPVTEVHRPGRGPVAICTVMFSMLLACCPGALALNPALDVSQYAHMSWKVRDRFVKGTVFSIAQTPDGYLWLGTEFGLVRFDGVQRVTWQPLSAKP